MLAVAFSKSLIISSIVAYALVSTSVAIVVFSDKSVSFARFVSCTP